MLMFDLEVDVAMICANCLRQIDAGEERCPACTGDPVLDGRFRLDRVVVEDAQGVSYRATRLDDGRLLRVRAMPLGADSDRAALLERHAAAEIAVDHPGLARGIEALSTTTADANTLWRIHEQVRSQTLAETAASEPERVREPAWILALLGAVAEALNALHNHQPPLAHGRLSSATILVRHGVGLDISTPSFLLVDLGLEPGTDPAADLLSLGQVALELLGLDPDAPELERVTHPRLHDLLTPMLAADPSQRPLASELVDACATKVGEIQTNRSPPTAAAKHPPTPRFMMIEPMPERGQSRQKPRSAEVAPRKSRLGRVKPAAADIPVMRPEDLSRELSQAYRATAALEDRQRKHLTYARMLVVILTAVIAALATYLALKL